MPKPSSFYTSKTLTNVAAGYRTGAGIAAKVLPMVNTPEQKGEIFKNDADKRYLIPRDTTRAPGAPHNVLDYDDPTTVSYNCKARALKGIVPDELRKQAEPGAALGIVSTKMLMDNIWLQFEIEVVAEIVANVSATAVSAKWNTTGTPIDDILGIYDTVGDSAGAVPNAIAMDEKVLRLISQTAYWRDRVKYTMTPESINALGNAAILADLLNIPRQNVFISTLKKNTAKEGQAASISPVWGANVLSFYTETPGLVGIGTPALGLTPKWTGGEGMDGFLVATDRDNDRVADEIYADVYLDPIILNAGSGHLFTGVLG